MDIKHCSSCGRPFEKQKRFEKNWDEIKYCSAKCRKERLETKQKDLEEFILKKLTTVTNICPSQIASELYGEEKMKQMMEPVRCACRRLQQAKRLKITQNKKPVTSLNFRGPVRIEKL